MSLQTELTHRERAAIAILLFIVKLINPTTYEHQINELKADISKALGEETK
jgi:hypothetical protein